MLYRIQMDTIHDMNTMSRTDTFCAFTSALVYCAREGRVAYLLLIGGDKSTQKRDIKTAIAMWKQIQKEQP